MRHHRASCVSPLPVSLPLPKALRETGVGSAASEPSLLHPLPEDQSCPLHSQGGESPGHGLHLKEMGIQSQAKPLSIVT